MGSLKRRTGRKPKIPGKRQAYAGVTFGVVVVVFSLGGFWLDARLGSSPAFLLSGLGLGAVGGFIHLVETVAPGTLFPSRRPGSGGGGEEGSRGAGEQGDE